MSSLKCRFLPLVGMTNRVAWAEKEKGGSGRNRFPTPVRRQNLLDSGTGSWRRAGSCAGTAMHVVHHALFVAVHDLRGFGPLVGRENGEQLRLDSCFGYDEFGHGLSLFRSLGADRWFIKCWALFESSHLLMAVRHLLHERLKAGLFLVENRLGLRLLGVGEVERIGQEGHNVFRARAKAAAHSHVCVTDRGL